MIPRANEMRMNQAAVVKPGINTPSRSRRTAAWVKRVSYAFIVLGLLALLKILPAAHLVQAVVAWVEQLGPLAPFAFVGVYLVATVFMLPAWPLSVAAGVLFGLVGGTAAVVSGATFGMAATFLIGRYLARPAVERKFRQYPRFAAIDHAVGEGGWKIVALLRLSPAVPFNLQNYLYGLTAIRFWPCILASAVAILPGTFMYVYFGYAGRASLGAAQSGRGMGQWALLIIGLLATIAVTVYVTKLARKAIQEQTQVDARSSSSGNETETEARTPKNPWIGAGAAATTAVLVLLAVGCAAFKSTLLVRLFGPPRVSLSEAYAAKVEGPHFDHAPFDAILWKYVNDKGGVDYTGLRSDREPLHKYVASLANAPFEELGRNEKLALLINAYNSFTLELIVDWPDKNIRSIQDIPSEKRWDGKRWNIGGQVWSLNQIEHEQIRPKFREPNVHFALVCAAVGCPPLRAEAYTASRIEEQLEDQARIVHANGSRWFQFAPEAQALHLTSLYKWYGSDFEQVAGTVLDYAAKYAPSLAKAIESGRRPSIEWFDYDWSLNGQENLN